MKSKLSPILHFALLLTAYSLQLTAAFAQEQLTITTYYPSPSGSYRELRAQRVAIGDNYIQRANACWDGPAGTCTGAAAANIVGADADLVVEGNVGIGTITPTTPLHIQGPATGAIRIVDGNQGPREVLTSDNDGIGTWQFPLRLPNTVKVEGTTDINTNSLSWVNMPDMSATITTHGGGLLISFSATVKAEEKQRGHYRILIDGEDVFNGRYYLWQIPNNIDQTLTSFSWYKPVTAGAHTVIIQWRSSVAGHAVEQGGTIRPRVLIVSEQ